MAVCANRLSPMADIVSPEVRSRMMAGIRGKNTKPELLIRTNLHKLGFRFRLHDPKLPGKPDLVLPKWRAAIFIHGCFWHFHGCKLFRIPKTRSEFWREKLVGNRDRDALILKQLHDEKWRVLIIWECALRGRCRQAPEDLMHQVSEWIQSENNFLELSGRSV